MQKIAFHSSLHQWSVLFRGKHRAQPICRNQLEDLETNVDKAQVIKAFNIKSEGVQLLLEELEEMLRDIN